MASSPAAVRELQRDLENQANALSKIQKGTHYIFSAADIAKNHQVRKQYTIQLGENELVLKELELLNETSNVYKLIEPVLVMQDLAEANANVQKGSNMIGQILGSPSHFGQVGTEDHVGS
ncbi:hypothetical protein GW17_00040516 [Ensete ventricosum]|nr:hypothetical protein GW17_00040516 [Ensete ventricosum]RZR83789.1 hypothetical protein BHM03_00010511 [Ensete ventricosum]